MKLVVTDVVNGIGMLLQVCVVQIDMIKVKNIDM